VLQTIVNETSGEDADLTLANMLDSPFPELKGPERIRGAFTKSRYRERICPHFEDYMKKSEAWVMASEERSHSLDTQTQELRSGYFTEYTKEWRRFVDSLSLDVAPEETALQTLFERLTKKDSPPFLQLFRSIAANVRFTEPKKEADSKSLVDDMKNLVKRDIAGPCQDDEEKRVEREFDGFVGFGVQDANSKKKPPLDFYQEQLQKVSEALKNKQDKKGSIAAIDVAVGQVKPYIAQQEAVWQPRLEQVLLPPFKIARSMIIGGGGADASRKWCSEVYLQFKKTCLNRYPFRQNPNDAKIADVAEFFKPSGILWSFYGRELKEDIPQVGESYKLATPAARSMYRGDLLTFLSHARQVTTSLFSVSSPDAQVNFQVQIHEKPGVRTVKFRIDDQPPFEYYNGPPEWRSMKWPVGGKWSGARLDVQAIGGNDFIERTGEWGLFRLLETATSIQITQPGTMTVTWQLPKLQMDITIDIKPDRAETPFGMLKAGQKPQLLQAFHSAANPPPAAAYNTGGCTQ
jgi:type VI protein secretion system component VasK